MRRHALGISGFVGRAALDDRTPWLRALAGRRTRLPDFDHYPSADVVDPVSGGQFFLHAHDRDINGHAHFHCFVRLPGARYGLRRRRVTTHLAAVAVDRNGWPTHLLALNQWVTDEFWQPARRTLALLPAFGFAPHLQHAEVGALLRGVLESHWPELAALLALRDRRLRAALARRPDRNVLLDRDLEVIAARRIDLHRRLRDLDAFQCPESEAR